MSKIEKLVDKMFDADVGITELQKVTPTDLLKASELESIAKLIWRTIVRMTLHSFSVHEYHELSPTFQSFEGKLFQWQSSSDSKFIETVSKYQMDSVSSVPFD